MKLEEHLSYVPLMSRPFEIHGLVWLAVLTGVVAFLVYKYPPKDKK